MGYIAELIERREASVELLQFAVPDSHIDDVAALAELITDPMNLAYCVGLIEFYDNQADALSIVHRAIVGNPAMIPYVDFGSLYEAERIAFEDRQKVDVPNGTQLLEYRLYRLFRREEPESGLRVIGL